MLEKYSNDLDIIEKLIFMFSKLPGLGTRSARRIILHLLSDKEVRMKSILEALNLVFLNVRICEICNNISENSLCKICSSNNRDKSIIAIVETVAELWALERSEIFSGTYHVLGINSKKTDNMDYNRLGLDRLLKRCKESQVDEIIIATNATLEGQTTAYFITEFFKDHKIKTSRLANGIPFGGELDYLDEGTVSAALSKRYLM
ncbi:MAG: recombination protein RecR [Rickettsia sp.]|nr:recombination protein RecR [Rickettsia sp.]